MENKEIKVDINDKNSIKNALDEYLKTLNIISATKEDGFSNYGDISFTDLDGNKLTKEDFDKLLKLYIKLKVDMGRIIIDRVYKLDDLNEFEYYLKILKEINGQSNDLAYITIKDLDYEYIKLLNKYFPVVDYINSRSWVDKMILLDGKSPLDFKGF